MCIRDSSNTESKYMFKNVIRLPRLIPLKTVKIESKTDTKTLSVDTY